MKKAIIYISVAVVLPLLYGLLNYGMHYSKGTDVGDSRPGKSYYVSNLGSDDNSGTSIVSPWKTVQKVNQYELSPGDTVYFQKGGVWRGQLVPQSGDETGRIRYTAYGFGGNPQLLGSIEKNKEAEWTPAGNNIWTTGPFETDVGNIILDNGLECGVKVWNESDLKAQNDFWFDLESKMLKIYSLENPARSYRDIECALRREIINQSNKSYVIYDGLSLKCGGAHGISGINTSYITVQNCVISFIGGGDQYMDGREVRFGNGVEFWNDAHDVRVEKCRIFEIYDAAVTNQGRGENNSQYNITYSGNQIWNCEYSFEYWNAPQGSITQDIFFENNTCRNAGGGWGHTQRPDPSGRHICFYDNAAQTENIMIRGNVFDSAEEACIFLSQNWSGINGLFLENNTYIQEISKTFAKWQEKSYSVDRFNEYKAYTGKDSDSNINFLEVNENYE